ncbi:MAG: peptidoglycan DD-metalloendopeptidase family protein [Lachnospiraceae bacterium]
MLLLAKRKRSAFMCLFLIGIFITCYLYIAHASSLSDITSDSIEQKQEEIESAQEEQESIQNTIEQLQSDIAKLEEKKDDVETYITQLDVTVGTVEARIKAYENQVTEKEAEIADKELELEQALLVESDQYEDMSKRIQYMYEVGEETQLEMLLTARSFSEFLNRAEYVSALSAYDNSVLEAFILTREYVELTKESLEADKLVLEEIKLASEVEKEQLEDLKNSKTELLLVYESDIELTQEYVSAEEEALAYQSDLIASLEEDIDDERKQIAADNGLDLNYNGGLFTLPYPNYVRMSSDFGWRTDPFTGLSTYHSGVDWAGPEGDAIVAAYEGVVAKAEYNASMGNYVMIDHGNNLYTIYMHASKLYVSENDVVAKGETIAAVGTTGRSTGSHLHFSVRLNGEYVSPWDYLE